MDFRGVVYGEEFKTKMDIKKELEQVQKKIDEIKRRQDNLQKLQDLQDRSDKMKGTRPFNHAYEMY